MDEKADRLENKDSTDETESADGTDETQPTEAAQETESAEDIEEYITPDLKACIFTVGGEEFSIELDYLKEIAELSEVVPLPLSPPYIEGITHQRGEAIPVVNIAVLRNIHEERAAARWLIVLEIENDRFGIAVNEMPDLSSDYRGELINISEFFETHRVR